MFKIKNFRLLITFFIAVVFATTAFATVDSTDDIDIVVKMPVNQLEKDVPKRELPVSNVKATDETVDELEEINDLAPIKKPKSILFKFAVSILWVIISSLIIYFSLFSYKRMSKKKDFGINVDENNLDSPKNFKEAVNLFLKKTKDEE